MSDTIKPNDLPLNQPGIKEVVDEGKKELDVTKFQIYEWIWIWTKQDPFNAMRIQWWWTLLKWNKILETGMFWFFDIDWNPLETKWFGKLMLNKKIYKWLGTWAEYTFTWSWNNVTKLWLFYAWKTINVIVSAWRKVWKNWNIALFLQARYGWLIKEPFVSWVAWVRLNIK